MLVLLRWRANRPYQDNELLSVLPSQGAILLYMNTAALREGGILDLLAGSKAAEDADYRKFVEQIGFDYRTDLDAIAGSLTGDTSYFAVRGRFQWKQLANYAAMQGGECRNTVCTMPGSTAERNVSFYPLERDVLVVAFSVDPKAVTNISPALRNQKLKLPTEPVWVSIPGSRLKKSEVESAMATFIAPLESLAQVQAVTLAAGLAGNWLQVRMAADCNSAAEAARLKTQLSQSATSTGADGTSMASLLAAGTFEQHDAQVTGRWQLDRSLLQSIAGSGAR